MCRGKLLKLVDKCEAELIANCLLFYFIDDFTIKVKLALTRCFAMMQQQVSRKEFGKRRKVGADIV